MTHKVLCNSVAWSLNTGTANFKLWYLPLTTGIYFLSLYFLTYCELTLNYVKAFITLQPLILSPVSPTVLLQLIPKFYEQLSYSCSMFHTGKFHYQNQQQKSDTSHFTLINKSCHTSCRLQIVLISFLSDVVQ